ncbi:Aspartate aminotransferase [Rickettsiales bacterium Ac37b]|nr:Aspartate aminotransferase [Rickettsiales bacterium Ac37b]
MALIAKRLQKIKPSPTLVVTSKAAALRAQNIDIIGLGAGEPDFDTPENIKEVAITAIKQGATKYTDVSGTAVLKKAISNKFLTENNIEYKPEQIIVGCGAKHVIYNAFMASLDTGDEVIIPSPFWTSYPDMVLMAEGVPVVVPCTQQNNFKLTASALEKAITGNTKWLILNSPNNPTGSVYNKEELRALADVLLKYAHVNIISDDIYEHIIFDNHKFYTLAQIEPKLYSRILTVNGVSKSYSMTGWRIGYAGGPIDLIKAMTIMQSQSTTNPCSISQAAAHEALTGTQSFMPENQTLFSKRRDLVLSMLSEIELLNCNIPEGAFYIFPNCTAMFGKVTPEGKIIKNSDDVADYLLEKALVAVVSGTAFGMDGFFRISYATSDNLLKKACERIANACKLLK